MKAVLPSVALRDWLLKRPDWLDHQTVVALVFALKTYAASMLALLIAFWAGLDDPRWAFLTVFIVSQPDSGLVLAKSFYRILGTIVGLLLTVALVFALAQYGELFVAAVAAWICFCNFAARAVRNFESYGFQLAGYTLTIVAIPAALNPSGAYPLVVARFTEILLGIVCAALVSRLVLVRELSPKLVDLVRSLTGRADRFAMLLLDPDADRERVAAERRQLVQRYLEVEAMQRSAYFESAEARVLDQPLRRLTRAAVELCATADASASHRLGSLPEPGTTSIGKRVSDADQRSAENDAMASAMVRAADDRDIASARARLRDAAAALDRGEEPAERRTACSLWSDPVSATLAALRCALAVAITSALWFSTAWPNGPTAVVVAAVLCSLLASMEQPDKLTMAAAVVVVVAAILGFATQFYLLPIAVDFPSMAVMLAPLVLTCSFIMAQPRIAPFGLLAVVYFAVASNIENVMTYDAVAVLNASVAALVGVGVSVVLFATFFPETPAYASQRFRRQLRVHLSYLIDACPCMPALRCYQLALGEQLGVTLARLKHEPPAARDCFTSAVAALSSAQAISRLQSALDAGELPPRVAGAGSRLLARLSQTLRKPSMWKFSKRAAEARVLCRHALAGARGSAEAEGIEALSAVVVACQTLGSDLMRARMLLQEKFNAIRA